MVSPTHTWATMNLTLPPGRMQLDYCLELCFRGLFCFTEPYLVSHPTQVGYTRQGARAGLSGVWNTIFCAEEQGMHNSSFDP